MTSPQSTIPALRYRFDDVVIEPHGRRVFVGGRERNASLRAFNLLQILCEQPGRVLTRDELSDRLWPGGQIVSDEALTQAIFRARAVLGPQGERIVTVRGMGIRFDAAVERETDGSAPSVPAPAQAQGPAFADAEGIPAVAAPVPVSDVASPHPAADRRHANALVAVARFRAPLRIVLVLVPLVLLAWWFWPQRGPEPIDAGYGITDADVHALHADSARLLGEAIAHDNGGDRARARALLEALDDSDARTPWPALLLGLWAGGGSGDVHTAEGWLARARERAAPLRDRYVSAMLRYVEAENDGTPQDVIRYAGAVLDLRPDAWRMRLARAHLKNFQGMREAALAEIRDIRIDGLGNRKLEMTLADRASLGDVEGAQAVLDGLPRTTDAAAWEYLAGRIAWSRGDAAAARAAWERAAVAAQKNGRYDIGNLAQAYAGFVAMLAGDHASAVAHFERARVGAGETGEFATNVDLSLLLAQMYALDGKAGIARVEFERAAALATDSGGELMAMQTALVGARLFPAHELTLVTDRRAAAQALLAARRARAVGDDETARCDLATAQQRGILDLGYADEARLLAAELGMPVAAEKRLDPLHPPLSAVAARLFLAALASGPAPDAPAGSPSNY